MYLQTLLLSTCQTYCEQSFRDKCKNYVENVCTHIFKHVVNCDIVIYQAIAVVLTSVTSESSHASELAGRRRSDIEAAPHWKEHPSRRLGSAGDEATSRTAASWFGACSRLGPLGLSLHRRPGLAPRRRRLCLDVASQLGPAPRRRARGGGGAEELRS